MKMLFISVSLVVLLNYTINADETNYCNDPEANQQWEILIQENPQDMEIASLHALRIGLCYKVEREDISVSQATEIFENVRMQLIKKKTKERLRKSNKTKL